MTELDPYAEGGALEAAYFLFQDLDLPLPPIPAPFAGLLRQRGRAMFSTRPRVETLTDLDALVDEAIAGDAPPYLAFGHEGYGTNNWFLRYAVVQPGLAIFLELPFGGAYQDEEACRGDIALAFREAEALLDVDGGDPVVIEHRAGARSRWRRADDDAWRDAPDASSTALSAALSAAFPTADAPSA